MCTSMSARVVGTAEVLDKNNKPHTIRSDEVDWADEPGETTPNGAAEIILTGKIGLDHNEEPMRPELADIVWEFTANPETEKFSDNHYLGDFKSGKDSFEIEFYDINDSPDSQGDFED